MHILPESALFQACFGTDFLGALYPIFLWDSGTHFAGTPRRIVTVILALLHMDRALYSLSREDSRIEEEEQYATLAQPALA
jgi:hypothetical protein